MHVGFFGISTLVTFGTRRVKLMIKYLKIFFSVTKIGEH